MHLSLSDSYEWAYEFRQKFGLFEVDLITKERSPRPSILNIKGDGVEKWNRESIESSWYLISKARVKYCENSCSQQGGLEEAKGVREAIRKHGRRARNILRDTRRSS
uniref:Uncharacterized protein n=1 Tax=Ignisphaera aggregans TaxID=334771 RepID=A0A7C4BB60_9CREN